MRVFYGKFFRGIRLYDADQELIVDEDWREYELGGDEKWTQLQEIPDGQQIIGVQADDSNSVNTLIALSFMLGPIPDLSRDLNR